MSRSGLPLAFLSVGALAVAGLAVGKGSPNAGPFRVEVSGTGRLLTAKLYVGDQEVGHAQLSRVSSLSNEDLNPFECVEEIEQLVRMVGHPCSYWTLWRTGILKKYRGKGGGVQMYEHLLMSAQEITGKTAILFPEECMEEGETTEDAHRVWSSLSKRWLNYGRAVASVRRS